MHPSNAIKEEHHLTAILITEYNSMNPTQPASASTTTAGISSSGMNFQSLPMFDSSFVLPLISYPEIFAAQTRTCNLLSGFC